jgi:hypothetical protein
MAMGERIWLKHKETGGYFHAPVSVVDVFEGLGWEPCEEPPAEANPVVAERVAFERALAADRTKKVKGRPKPAPKPEPEPEPEDEPEPEPEPEPEDDETFTPRRGTTEQEG